MVNGQIKVKVVKPRIPKMVICPTCGQEQPFKKKGEYWKTVKEIHSEHTLLLNVQMIKVKCLNIDCPRKSFALPVRGIERYARCTSKMKVEAVAGIVQDNSTLPRISKRLNRSFNTTGSKSAIDRWKHNLADQYDIADIIKAIGFSGILGLDEYMPRRSNKYELISTDGLKPRILYIEPIEKRNFKQVEAYLETLRDRFALHPWAIIFDLWKPFPGTAKKVFGNDILIQYDYFHIMKVLHWHLRNALAQYRKHLKEIEDPRHGLIWKHKWTILKNAEYRSEKERQYMKTIMRVFKKTLVQDILEFKEWVRDIFLSSKSKEDAIRKRDFLTNGPWLKRNEHFGYMIKYLKSYAFNYMITFLEHPEVPRSGNSENMISVWRQMEAVRFGFRINKGRLDHLKLYQISKYLGGKLPQKWESCQSC